MSRYLYGGIALAILLAAYNFGGWVWLIPIATFALGLQVGHKMATGRFLDYDEE